jgi:hypothetical protein
MSFVFNKPLLRNKRRLSGQQGQPPRLSMLRMTCHSERSEESAFGCGFTALCAAGHDHAEASQSGIHSKTVPRFQFALVDFGVVRVHAPTTRGPAQVKRRPQRKNDGLAVDVGLDANPFRIGRHGEMKRLAEDYRIR